FAGILGEETSGRKTDEIVTLFLAPNVDKEVKRQMSRLVKIIAVLLLVLMFPITAHAEDAESLAVMPKYIAAVNSGDVDTALAQYADDATFIAADGSKYIGRVQVRTRIQALVNQHNHFDLVGNPKVEGDR